MGSQWSFLLSRMMKSVFVACVLVVASAKAGSDAFNINAYNNAPLAYSFSRIAPYPHPYGPRVFKRSADSFNNNLDYFATYGMPSFSYDSGMIYASPYFGFHSMAKRSSDSDSFNAANIYNAAPVPFDNPAFPYLYHSPGYDFTPMAYSTFTKVSPPGQSLHL